MTTKLVIYDYDICGKPAYYSENANADGSIKSWGYCGISEEKAKITAIKEVYEGVAAAVKLWDMTFDNLSDKDKQIILSVFPTLLERDKVKLKPPCEIISIARAKIRKHFGITCPRCGGSGSYARSVAYTEVDDGICHLCGGSGKSLPRLTDKKLAEIKNYFLETAL